jgi:dTDP-4-amino-4,6-dideoxygalactose transaminase
MRLTPKAFFDAPPTAGLPLRAGDLLPGGDADLGAALARFLGVAEVQVESSGTAALIVALSALRELAPARDKVIVPAYTCPLVALAVVHCGLRLCLCDLAPDSLDLDPQGLAALCDERTLAILPTHLGGRIAALGPARDCARACGAWVIEDAAQALGARIAGRSVGADSDIAFFSLAVGKGLTLFEGGALLVRDERLRAACRAAAARLAPPRPWLELKRSVELLGYAACYRPAGLRLVYGLPLRRALRRGDWVAAADEYFTEPLVLHRVGRWRRAVGVRALARLPAFLAGQAARAAQRVQRLREIPGVHVLVDSEGEGVWPVLLLLLPDRARRDAVLQAHWGSGYGLSVPFVHALPDYAYLAERLPLEAPLGCAEARRLAGRLLAISNSPWLGAEDFEALCAALAEACGAAD